MSAQQYAITRLVMLNKQQNEDVDFLAHCGTAEASRDMALAYLRNRYGRAAVSLNEATGAIVVKGLFVGMPVHSRSPFSKVATQTNPL